MSMKKFCRTIALSCAAAWMAAQPLAALAAPLFPGGYEPSTGVSLDGMWSYVDDGTGEVFLSCKDKTITHAEVPEQINGITITTIEQDCFLENTQLESVVLPKTITHINDWAFSGCTSLKSINLPNGLEAIDWQAFHGCSSLEEITIPASVNKIEKFIFEGCTSMKAVNVSDGNKHYVDVDGVLFTADMATLMFYPPAKEGTSYTVPEGCTRIEDWAFIGNTSLETIDLSNVAEIGEDAFYHCTSLKTITIPETVTVLEPRTFGNCMAMESIQLSPMLDEIGEHCFYNCLALKEIQIPGRVDTIGESAFLNCPELRRITLYDAVKNIGDHAIGFYVDAETQKFQLAPDFEVETDKNTAAHQYCSTYGVKCTAGITQSSVFLTVIIVIIVLVIGATIALIIIQKRIQKRYELR